MATLSDSFLADLGELSDNQIDVPYEDVDADAMDGELADIIALNYDDLDSVSKLQKNPRYTTIMQKVEEALQKGYDITNKDTDDPEYQLIVECNALSVDIDNEIVTIHNFIRDNYRLQIS
ncbi:unnamed protein product [Rhodiola kirilowii]